MASTVESAVDADSGLRQYENIGKKASSPYISGVDVRDSDGDSEHRESLLEALFCPSLRHKGRKNRMRITQHFRKFTTESRQSEQSVTLLHIAAQRQGRHQQRFYEPLYTQELM